MHETQQHLCSTNHLDLGKETMIKSSAVLFGSNKKSSIVQVMFYLNICCHVTVLLNSVDIMEC
uniref:Uncharacterized protein n=1 Tax=Arundo donax TaxID=35708 RepID=A0A0A8Y059_ARUDO